MKRSFLLSCVIVGAFAACGGPGKVKRGEAGNSGIGSGASGGINLDGGPQCDPMAPGSPCGPDAPAPPGCGDGILTDDEACDDMNRNDGDGCQGNCLAVEPGYSCNPPGSPCIQIARCGDGFATVTEPCDDGNLMDGDGCNQRCKLEIGFKCSGTPSMCTPTVCGDGVQEGAESCEDGNDQPFDGCSSLCQTEPDCSAGVCTSDCGDGLVIDEDCDDGNQIAGDGCSPDCTIEPGFVCSVDAGCEMRNGQCILRVPVIYRDFNASHSDFGMDGTACAGTNPPDEVATGMVQAELDANGKPVLSSATLPNLCVSSFTDWYTNGANSTAIVSELILWPNMTGGFVNRWGPNGEQWASDPVYTNMRWCGPPGTMCGPDPAQYVTGCTLAPGEQCWDPCTIPSGCSGCSCAGSVSASFFDGTPLFFPIDAAPGAGMDHDAKIPPVYGYNWQWEDQVLPTPGGMHMDMRPGYIHNFYFTTEVVYWFQYDPAEAATLDFTGDDDVWVFVNGHLAVDLGGLHSPENGSVTINAASQAAFGLTPGGVHKITVFHAERKIDGSSFRLTLDGFKTTRSDCSPVCGDGIVGLGEQCDDGVNDGGYGECAANCVLAEYCGDGIVQMPQEYCDDGNRIEGDTCNNSCRKLIVF